MVADHPAPSDRHPPLDPGNAPCCGPGCCGTMCGGREAVVVVIRPASGEATQRSAGSDDNENDYPDPVRHENTHDSVAVSSLSIAVSSNFRGTPSDSAISVGRATSLVAEYFSEKNMLRASTISSVLHGRCEVLAGSMGSEDTYAMSCVVEGIDTFISHNWSVTRADKFCALSLFFNLNLLAYYFLFVVAVAVVLEYSGLSPRLRLRVPDGLHPGAPHEVPLTCQLLSFGSILVLTLGHEVVRLCGLGGTTVFLDKTCIDQRTAEARALGISKLGTFIVNSRKLFVIYTDVYFARLWTVYEIATFLLLKPECEIILFPTIQARLILFSFVAVTAIRVPYLCVFSESVVGVLERSGLSFLSTAFWFLCKTGIVFAWLFNDRKWAHQQSCMANCIKHFSLEKAECSDERDREAVKRNILSFMRHVEGIAPPGSSDTEALTAFETYVRETLPDKLRDQGVMTRVAPYRCTLAVTHSISLHGIDLFWSTGLGGVFTGLAILTGAFCTVPLLYQLMHWFASRCLSFHFTRWKECLYLFPLSILMVSCQSALFLAFARFADDCHRRYTGSGVGRALGPCMFAGVVLLHVGLVRWCFGPPRCRGKVHWAWGGCARPPGCARPDDTFS